MGNSALAALLGSVSYLYISLLVVVVYFVVARLRQYYRLRQFKGPTTTGISWWWHSKAVLSGQAQRYYGDVTEKYGKRERLLKKREEVLTSKDQLQGYRLSI